MGETSELLNVFYLFLEKYRGAATRGILILGSMYLFFWILKPKFVERFRVQPPRGAQAKPLREMFYTFTTYIVYALAGVIVTMVYKTTGHTMMYSEVSQYGWFYTVGSVLLFMLYTDTTFYWSHVLMHKSRFFYRSHSHHHQFINVTPWAAYAFHTGEAILSAGSFMFLMLLFPWHPMALLGFVIISVSFNGLIHAGYDFFPKSWRFLPVLKWINTPTHHIYHHQKSQCNYSFFFTFWDKLMKTEKLPEVQEPVPKFVETYQRPSEQPQVSV
jgi:Delta7-sterol 5-desaturase